MADTLPKLGIAPRCRVWSTTRLVSDARFWCCLDRGLRRGLEGRAAVLGHRGLGGWGLQALPFDWVSGFQARVSVMFKGGHFLFAVGGSASVAFPKLTALGADLRVPLHIKACTWLRIQLLVRFGFLLLRALHLLALTLVAGKAVLGRLKAGCRIELTAVRAGLRLYGGIASHHPQRLALIQTQATKCGGWC